MKNALTILSLFMLFSCSQKLPAKTNEAKKCDDIQWTGKRDSILFETEYGSIYLSKKLPLELEPYFKSDDSKNEMYSSFYKQYIQETIDSFKLNYIKQKTPLSEIIMNDLHAFNNNPCLYSPSDWFATPNYKITDSIIYKMKSSDTEFYIIQSIKINKETITYDLTSIQYDYESGSPAPYLVNSQLTVKALNKQKGTYVWKWVTDNGTVVQQSIKVSSKKVSLYPIIIEDCGNQKCIFNQQHNYFEAITQEFIERIRN